MRIRSRLLLLIGLFTTAVLVNILALVFLARSMSSSLDDIERVRVRQLLAAQMNERLRNAESALYRYFSEGASGYAAAFDFQLAGFGQSVETYQGTALTDEERGWAKELALIRQDVRDLGQNLIRIHDQQTADLQKLIAAQAQLSNLLTSFKALRPADGDYQAALDGLNESAQRMLLTVTAYLTMPDERTRTQFMESSQRFQDSAAKFRRVTANEGSSDKAAQIDLAFDDLRGLGLQLISDRDYQLAWFTPFSADVFQGSQLVIAGEIQPLEAQRLSEAKRNLEAAVGAAIFTGLGLPLALTLVAAWMVWRLARQMDQNMLALLRGADRVAAGQLNEKIGVTTRDELMSLADAFNHMMTDLAAREQGLQARLAELETLRQVSLQITSTLDLDQVLNLIASSVLNLVDASHVHIYTRANNAGDLRLVAGAGQHRTPPSPIHAQPDSLAAQAASSGQPQILNRADGSTEVADARSL
jgi:nitrogen fixation/metabolism regulation signal transduction histidine kinase